MLRLVTEPATLITLGDGGVEIPKVDLGILFTEGGRVPVTSFVALDDEERRDLQILEQKNVPLVIQYVPTDPEEPFKA